MTFSQEAGDHHLCNNHDLLSISIALDREYVLKSGAVTPSFLMALNKHDAWGMMTIRNIGNLPAVIFLFIGVTSLIRVGEGRVGGGYLYICYLIF